MTLPLSGTSLTWNLAGEGTIEGGTVSTTDGAVLFGDGGALDGVTLDGALDIAGSDPVVTVTEGLTLKGNISLGSTIAGEQYAGQLVFQGAQTLGGTGSIFFSNDDESRIGTASSNGDSGTLTIGAGITIDGESGSIGADLPLVNQGTIDADGDDSEIVIGASIWTNIGTIEATSGGSMFIFGASTETGSLVAVDGSTLSINGTWTDTGTIIANDSTLNLEGTLSLGSGDRVTGTDDVINIEGTLDNTGSVLALTGTGQSWNLGTNGFDEFGSIIGGTISTTGGAVLVSSTKPPIRRSAPPIARISGHSLSRPTRKSSSA